MDNQQSQGLGMDQNISPNGQNQNNAYQKLGPKTFLFFIFDHIGISLLFLLATIVVIVVQNLTSGMYFIAPYSFIFTDLILTGFALFLLAAIVGFLIAWIEYSRFQFMLDADTFRIRRGVLTAEYISIPYRRIEAVDVKESLIYQMFGVSRITIEMTIDTELESDRKSNSNDEVLPAIDRDLALTIQSELTQRSNVQKMNIERI